MADPSTPGDFCFVHAADLHLDTPFKGVSETAPRIGAALREASLDAFDQLVELCLDREAAFLLVAGDVYDGAERGLRAQLRFRDGLQRLSDAGIDTFVVHGNHDPVDEGWSAVRVWPERVHFFGADEVECMPVARDGQVIATVQGISYGRREVTENLALRFSRPTSEGLKIGLLHCNVAGAPDG
ncbi:MAG: metallophosphoesterase family protein, partial [Acidimicrobiales bacterium]